MYRVVTGGVGESPCAADTSFCLTEGAGEPGEDPIDPEENIITEVGCATLYHTL